MKINHYENLLFLYLIFFFSCSKENDCQYCTIITESNYKEASNKCNGLANNYPAFEIINSQPFDELCGSEIESGRKLLENSTLMSLCDGVTYIVRTRLNCK